MIPMIAFSKEEIKELRHCAWVCKDTHLELRRAKHAEHCHRMPLLSLLIGDSRKRWRTLSFRVTLASLRWHSQFDVSQHLMPLHISSFVPDEWFFAGIWYSYCLPWFVCALWPLTWLKHLSAGPGKPCTKTRWIFKRLHYVSLQLCYSATSL